MRYDWIHERTVPEMPKVWFNRDSRRVWSMVSKAAERSRSVRSETLPASEALSRSLTIRTKAVSVLWLERYADWNGWRRLFDIRWMFSWFRTIFSSSFEMNGRFDTGR